MFGKIVKIETVHGVSIEPVTPLEGKGGRLGMVQMINHLRGASDMDGYVVETDKHIFRVLIENGQSCCESWGYLTSEDDLIQFIGNELLEVNLVDTALKQAVVDKEAEYGFDDGGIQFVNFVTDRGVFQLAVYNAHNGYYGHDIVIAKDNDILLSEVL